MATTSDYHSTGPPFAAAILSVLPMISPSPTSRGVNLPRVVFKSQLAAYFSVSPRYLWRVILTEELFEAGGFNRSDYVTAKRFPPHVTYHIYTHLDIRDLDAHLVDELPALEDSNGYRAPAED